MNKFFAKINKKYLIYCIVVIFTFLLLFIINRVINNAMKDYNKTNDMIFQEEKKENKEEHKKVKNEQIREMFNFYEQRIKTFEEIGIKEIKDADVGDIVIFGKEKIINKEFKEKYNDKFLNNYCVVLEKSDNKLKLMNCFSLFDTFVSEDDTYSIKVDLYNENKHFYDSDTIKDLNKRFIELLSEKEKKLLVPFDNTFIGDTKDIPILFPSDEDLYKLKQKKSKLFDCYASFAYLINISKPQWNLDYYNTCDFERSYFIMPHNISDLADRMYRIYDYERNTTYRYEYENKIGRTYCFRPVFYINVTSNK